MNRKDAMVSKFLKNSAKIFLGALLVISLVALAKIRVADPGQFVTDATEFYFVRHGQTDHNAGLIKKDVYGDIPLNAVGHQQVALLRPFIETLPIKTICCSPLLRARQTKDAINKHLRLPVVMISDLREGSHQDWCEIQSVKNKKNVSISKSLQKFLNRLDRGLKKALEQPGPVLIVAHGGVYSALCRILDMNPDAWAIANCTVLRFYKKADGFWSVQHIFDLSSGQIHDPSYATKWGRCEPLA